MQSIKLQVGKTTVGEINPKHPFSTRRYSKLRIFLLKESV